jgi:AcrR family transcriptional regulator
MNVGSACAGHDTELQFRLSSESSPVPRSVTTSKPERADKARNRARILEAASAAFAESGMETQMDDVATRAGVGVGTVYRHYATKDALMVAMVRRKFTQILEVSLAALEQEGEPFEIFQGFLRDSAAVTAQDAAAQAALMRAGDEVWQHAADIHEELGRTTQILVDRAQAAGTMRPDVSAADVPMLMCGVSASMAAGAWDWRRHLEIVLDGLRVKPSARGVFAGPADLSARVDEHLAESRFGES